MRNHDFTPSGVAGFNSAPPRQASGGEYFYNNLNYGMDNLLTYSPSLKIINWRLPLGIFSKKIR
jgi:hypothetical protein